MPRLLGKCGNTIDKASILTGHGALVPSTQRSKQCWRHRNVQGITNVQCTLLYNSLAGSKIRLELSCNASEWRASYCLPGAVEYSSHSLVEIFY